MRFLSSASFRSGKSLRRFAPYLGAVAFSFALGLGPEVLHANEAQAETVAPPGLGGAIGIEKQLYPEGLVSLSSRAEFSKNFFVVDKSRRILRVYQNENGLPKLMLEVPSDLGKRSGPKLKRDDFRTPVGIYFLQKKLTQPEIPFDIYGKLAFTTDYPNVFDKREQKTGSGIWLHAVPDQVPLTRGSRGCVVVRNAVVQKLADFVTLNQTPMVIFDKMTEVPLEDYQTERVEFLKFVEQWRTAWQNEDIETYIKFYDPTFFNAEMNYKQWYKHKKRLKGTYKSIRVDFSEPLILKNDGQVVIRMFQHYKSDLHEDFGEKTIHAHYSKETGFRIVREDWKPASQPADWQNTASIERSMSSEATPNAN